MLQHAGSRPDDSETWLCFMKGAGTCRGNRSGQSGADDPSPAGRMVKNVPGTPVRAPEACKARTWASARAHLLVARGWGAFYPGSVSEKVRRFNFPRQRHPSGCPAHWSWLR